MGRSAINQIKVTVVMKEYLVREELKVQREREGKAKDTVFPFPVTSTSEMFLGKEVGK